MKILFWTSAFFLFYTYIGYPLVLWVWARLFPGRPLQKDAICAAARNAPDLSIQRGGRHRLED